VGIASGSREVPGRKGLGQETIIQITVIVTMIEGYLYTDCNTYAYTYHRNIFTLKLQLSGCGWGCGWGWGWGL